MSQESLTEHDKSDIENLKDDLIKSLSPVFYSVPSSPTHRDPVESFKLESSSAPHSPSVRRGKSFRRSGSVQNLISDFVNHIQTGSKVASITKTNKMSEIPEIKETCTNIKRGNLR